MCDSDVTMIMIRPSANGKDAEGRRGVESLPKAERLLRQTRKSPNKRYSIHEPEVACIAKGKAHKPYEFGSKVSVVTTLRCHWKRRNAIEPIIGHLKSDHRLNRNRLKGVYGDTINALLSAAAFNFKKLLRAFCALLRTFLQNLSPTFLSAPSFMCPQCCV